jgi:hypothetical protein
MAIANDGSLPLVIERVKPSRFCSGSVNPNILAPGASGKLEVACRSDLYGPLREVLEIQSNDPKSPRTTIQLVANVTPLLAFDTQNVNLNMFFGEQRTQDVHLIGTLVDQARVKLKEPAVADVEIVPMLGNSGKPLGFRIHCKGRKVGTNVGNLFITTGLLQHPREVAVPYACKVRGTLEVDPTTPYINLKISGPKTVNIEVRSSQPDFQVQAVHVVEGPFAASFEPSGAARFRVKVTAVDQRMDDQARSATGTLVIVSNDRTEPHKELPLFGFGRVNRVERPENTP